MEHCGKDTDSTGHLHEGCKSFADHSLTTSQVCRYSRQILMPQVGTLGELSPLTLFPKLSVLRGLE